MLFAKRLNSGRSLQNNEQGGLSSPGTSMETESSRASLIANQPHTSLLERLSESYLSALSHIPRGQPRGQFYSGSALCSMELYRHTRAAQKFRLPIRVSGRGAKEYYECSWEKIKKYRNRATPLVVVPPTRNDYRN